MVTATSAGTTLTAGHGIKVGLWSKPCQFIDGKTLIADLFARHGADRLHSETPLVIETRSS